MSDDPKMHAKVGTTFGLAVQGCDRETHRAEQVYVYADPDDAESHPIVVHGWVGYSIPSRLRMTRRQTVELVGLLANALEEIR